MFILTQLSGRQYLLKFPSSRVLSSTHWINYRGQLIKPHVNNSFQLRHATKIRHTGCLSRSASYRSCVNARHLSKAAVRSEFLLVGQSTRAVIKCADKEGNKPKTIRIHYWCLCVSWRLITAAQLTDHIEREMRERFAHYCFTDCILQFFLLNCEG